MNHAQTKGGEYKLTSIVDPMWDMAYQEAENAYDAPGDQSPAEAAVAALERMRLPLPTFRSLLVMLAAKGRVVPDELWPEGR